MKNLNLYQNCFYFVYYNFYNSLAYTYQACNDKEIPKSNKAKPAVTKQIPDIEKIWKDNPVNNMSTEKIYITEPISTASDYNPTQNITLNNNVNKSKTVKKKTLHTQQCQNLLSMK